MRLSIDLLEQIYAEPHQASLYLPMEGLNSYRSAIAPLLFGADHPVLNAGRIASIQTLGGSGALKVGYDSRDAAARRFALAEFSGC